MQEFTPKPNGLPHSSCKLIDRLQRHDQGHLSACIETNECLVDDFAFVTGATHTTITSCSKSQKALPMCFGSLLH